MPPRHMFLPSCGLTVPRGPHSPVYPTGKGAERWWKRHLCLLRSLSSEATPVLTPHWLEPECKGCWDMQSRRESHERMTMAGASLAPVTLLLPSVHSGWAEAVLGSWPHGEGPYETMRTNPLLLKAWVTWQRLHPLQTSLPGCFRDVHAEWFSTSYL